MPGTDPVEDVGPAEYPTDSELAQEETKDPSGETEQPKEETIPQNSETEEKVCEESVRQMSEIDQEQAIAKEHGWHRLGRFYLEVTEPLPDEEVIEIATAQSDALMEIEKLELEKKAFDAEINAKIKKLQAAAVESAKRIQKGESVQSRYFPAFFDPATKERVWFDPEKNEEVKREEAKQSDYQAKLPLDQCNGQPVAVADVPANDHPLEPSPTEPTTETPAEASAPEVGDHFDPEKIICDMCGGEGYLKEVDDNGDRGTCYRCAGEGKVFAIDDTGASQTPQDAQA